VGENGAWDEISEVHTNNSEASYVVKGLLPFTVYSFRILAVNKLGMSAPSKESYYICTLRECKFYALLIMLRNKAQFF
jgi:receptor-type tyrosine-protein phosphatase gamma